MQKDYVVVKLISGEIVMAMFEGEDDKYVKVEYPIQIKTMIVPGLNRESIHASPYCQFSESTSFVLEKSHIIYIKKLHNQFISHYKSFMRSYDEALIPTTRDEAKRKELEELFDDEEGDLTIEEVNRRLDILEAIANAPSTSDDEPDEADFNFVEGNDTKH
jgi:hypothetical protein